MPRTEEDFAKTLAEVKWFVKYHGYCVWLVPTDLEYRISVVEPKPENLPHGTTACCFDTNMDIVDRVVSNRDWG